MSRFLPYLGALGPLGSLLLLPACQAPRVQDCLDSGLPLQAQERFVAGQTYYLPELAGGAECDALRWTVSERPEGNEDAIVDGADGVWRITPTSAGRYTFAVEGGAEPHELELGVVAASERPFENYNYYPSHSVTAVGEELWVANVQSPSITRVDPSTLAILGEIDVGPWPTSIAWVPGMEVAVVALRGADTLGLVELSSGRLIDGIWVGDEPAHVVLAPDGLTAYVALKGEGAVAVVDLRTRVRRARIEAVRDPLAMAISPDGATLWVASHRSGQPNRYPYDADPVEQERDVAVIDTATEEVVEWWLDVGTTLTGLLPSADGERLYMSRLRNDTEASLGDPEQPNFLYEVAVFDAASGAELASADLGRQPSSVGPAVALHGLALAAGQLWVVSEGSDLAIALDPEGLGELSRVTASGRPRSVTAVGDTVYVHGAQGSLLTAIDDPAAAPRTVILTEDPRPSDVIDGQAYFTGAGQDFATNWNCNSCHTDGLGDTLIWNAGPFEARYRPSPFFWLEGTYPLGIDAYVSSVDNFAFTVNTNVGIRPNTDQYRALSAYLASIVPPPPANGHTRRDGSLTELGEQGRLAFEGEAGCASCHPLPLTTNRALLDSGITFDDADVPSLVGAYRHGVWLKHGEAHSLPEATDAVFATLGDPGLGQEQREALDRFLLELTARDFMVLTSEPRAGSQLAAVDRPIEIVLSHPAFDDPGNLARVRLLDAGGAEVAITRTLSADGRHLRLDPEAPLSHSTGYTVVLDHELESFDGRSLWTPDLDAPAPWEIAFTTAPAPELRLSGDYVWVIDMPGFDIENQIFDPEQVIPTAVTLQVGETPSGGLAVLDYGQDLVLQRSFLAAGAELSAPPLPVPVGPSFADGSGLDATLVDEDGDGIADRAEGTLTISGPGFRQDGIAWRLTRPTSGECIEGSEGDLPVTVELEPDGPVVDWGSTRPDALGVYFLGPGALPPAGPGQPVMGGEVFWALQLAEFPNGFAGPVTYGVVPPGAVDDTAAVGGGEGPTALEPGDCVTVTVLTTGFEQGSVTFIVP